MKLSKPITLWGWISSILFVLCINIGCASTKGSYSPVVPLKEGVDLSKYSKLLLEVTNNNNVALTETDKTRIKTQIIASLHKEYPNRFKDINMDNPDLAMLQIVVNITRYDKGSAFGRLMLAVIGGMHIDADVILNDYASKECLARYETKKTFAWGGIYGGMTRIEDIEEGFSKAVVASFMEPKK